MSHSSHSVARRLLDQANGSQRDISPMKLMKLVYIAHGWMLGLYGRALISDRVEAWRYGPVIPELYRTVRKFRAGAIPPDKVEAPGDEHEFDEYEKGVIDQVYDIYGGNYSAIQLSQMTHARDTPWDKTYNRVGRSSLIPNDLIEDHYRRLYAKHGDL